MDMLEKIRERNENRKIAEMDGILGGVREGFEVDFLLRHIDSLQKKVDAVLALADEWEIKAGPGSKAEEVFGPQKVSVVYAVQSIREAVGGDNT